MENFSSINEFTAIQRIKQSRVTCSKHQFYCILSEAADSSVVNVFIVNFLGGKFKQHLWANVVDTFSKPSSFESKINRYEPIGIVERKIQDCVCKQADFLLQFRLFFTARIENEKKEQNWNHFLIVWIVVWVCCFTSFFFVTYNKRLSAVVSCVFTMNDYQISLPAERNPLFILRWNKIYVKCEKKWKIADMLILQPRSGNCFPICKYYVLLRTPMNK